MILATCFQGECRIQKARVEAYLELETAGLLQSPTSLKSFWEWFGSFSPTRSEDLLKQKDSCEVAIYFEVDQASFTAEDLEKVKNFSVTLNEPGMKTWKLIAEVVADQIVSHAVTASSPK